MKRLKIYLFVILSVLLCLSAVRVLADDDDEELTRNDIVDPKIKVDEALERFSQFPTPGGSKSKNAYVIIHYEGTPKVRSVVLHEMVVNLCMDMLATAAFRCSASFLCGTSIMIYYGFPRTRLYSHPSRTISMFSVFASCSKVSATRAVLPILSVSLRTT